MRIPILGLLAFVAAHLLGAQQRPAPLTATDFQVLPQLGLPTDSASVRRLLGRPDSTVRDSNTFDPGAFTVSWFYRGFEIFFPSPDAANAITLLTRRLATHRGLRVGDSLARAAQLYGTPNGADNWRWYLRDPKDGMHVILIQFAKGRVELIRLGWLMD